MIIGVDISKHQGANIDFNLLSQQASFMFIRSSLGLYTDPLAVSNAKKAAEFKIPHGMYHVIVPTSTAKMSTQLATFKNVMLQAGSKLRCVIDVEVSGVGAQLLKDFCSAVEDEFGHKPIIYTRQSFWKGLVENGGISMDWAADYPLWVASYRYNPDLEPAMPSTWEDWTIWQYSDKGPGAEFGLKAYEASVIDLNVIKNEYRFAEIMLDEIDPNSLPTVPNKVEITAGFYFGRTSPAYVDETKGIALLTGTELKPTGNQQMDPINDILWMEVEIPENLRKVWISRNSNYIREIQ